MNNPQTYQPDFFGREIRTSYEENEPLFNLKDVCSALEIRNHRDAASRLDSDELKGVGITDPLGGHQTAHFVTESGLYHLIFMSRKPVAKTFRKWVTSEVLPAIRRTGFYAVPPQTDDTQPLETVYLRVQDYLALRGISASPHGFGHTCIALCRKMGVDPQRLRKRGHRYPLRVLDAAAHGKRAQRGPLIPREQPHIFTFLSDRK